MIELLRKEEMVIAELKNGLAYVFTPDLIGNLFLSLNPHNLRGKAITMGGF